MAILLWRSAWLLSFIGSALIALPAFLFTIHDISGDGENTYGIDRDAVNAMQLFLFISYFPAIAAVFLPVKSGILRFLACVMVVIVTIRLVGLLSL
ncbi:hypothetical protein ACFPOI_51295 [Nonomuraea angiospora]|uniref:Uncharacterized protein n=1 Tax=Nonomuraea angiospora TaxID=46172 RepID=A0ABR9M1I7_9ACTN|nr:hypothetical protein [Nonomuraea angiospora]MBE1586745.1 hypothetical protein [Nonomuraea angiospora]